MNRSALKILSLAAGLCLASTAHASLVPFQTYVGSYGFSSDGFGSTSDAGPITASVPVGATVTAAYFYSAYFGGTYNPSVNLNGTAANFTSNVLNTSLSILGAARADVTAIVAPVINGGPGGIYTFNVNELNGGSIDGEALIVVYSLASIPNSTVAILDGFSAIGGDSTAINFSNPLDPTLAGFQATMIIGDGFSCCGQASNISVDGTLITSVAGNNDDSKDSTPANGNLITVGGYNDPFSPLLPAYAQDHEKYDLTPEITKGDTTINIRTVNPSQDDNIFLAVFDVSGSAAINAPPPPPPTTGQSPEPSSIVLMLTGAGAMATQIRRRFAR